MYKIFVFLSISRTSPWNPYYVCASDQIERLQKKFTRLMYFKFRISNPRPPYDVRLKCLKLHSLETRRLENDEIMLFKLMHNHVDSSLRQRISLHQPLRVTRQVSDFYLPLMVTNYQSNSPLHRLQKNHDAHFQKLDIRNGNASLLLFKKVVRNAFEWWKLTPAGWCDMIAFFPLFLIRFEFFWLFSVFSFHKFVKFCKSDWLVIGFL